MTGEPAFFEIGVEDPERGRAFYGALFGWELTSTGGGHQIGTPGIPGGLHGGDKGAVPWLFFRVDDMDAALARLHELGGSVEVMHEGEEETAASIARYGRFKWCRDDQGSAFGLHQPPA
jgi:predicted enzyme related to lactoylglutathione lyase